MLLKVERLLVYWLKFLSYLSFSGKPSFIEGWCPGSKAPVFNRSNSFATAPIVHLNRRSFSISCWIKPTRILVTGDHTFYSDWSDPWQFHFGLRDQRVIFVRHSSIDEYRWYSVHSSVKISLNIWTHVVVTWDHSTGNSTIYVDGKNVGYRMYPPGKTFFYSPTGKPYKIGNDGHWRDHQYYGSVMDLYVFGTALSLDEINKLKGRCLIPLYKHKSLTTEINCNLNQ